METALAVVLALAALVTATVAWRSWALTERAMREGRPLPSNPAMAVVLLRWWWPRSSSRSGR